MKYKKEDRLEIGRRVYTREISLAEAELEYGVGRTCIQNYVRRYKETNNIPANHRLDASKKTPLRLASETDIAYYESMTREQLIDELIKAKVNEARAKKGYEVKGDGANKEFVPLSNKNLKS